MVQADEGRVRVPSTHHAETPSAYVDEFDAFFESTYPLLLKIAMAVGATLDEAEDAADETMTYVYRRWADIVHHRAYARRAVVTSVAKTRKRDGERVNRTIAAAQATPAVADDTALTAWENRQWVLQHLNALPPAQRTVMACVIDNMSVTEIAAVLGKNEATVRKNLQWARERLKRELATEHEREQRRGAVDGDTTRREAQ